MNVSRFAGLANCSCSDCTPAACLTAWWLPARTQGWEVKLICNSEGNVNLTFHFLGIQLGSKEMDFFPLKCEASQRGEIESVVIEAILFLTTNPEYIIPSNDCAVPC